MKKYDLHMHTSFSPDSGNRPEDLLRRAKEAGLNGLAITDHQTIEGALATRRLNGDKDFEVIVGEEVTTDHGDVLALYTERHVAAKDLLDVIEDIKSQGGIVIVPHPFRPTQRFSYPFEKLVGKIDAIEVVNSRTPDSSNNKAAQTAKALNIAAVGSSDAHILMDVGKAYTTFEGGLREAIANRGTKGVDAKDSSVALLSHLTAGILKGSRLLGQRKRQKEA
jgi:predicted metal-dependent phosphoesterase TrpH